MSDKHVVFEVQGGKIRATEHDDGNDFICLTDIAIKFGTQEHIKNWIQNKNTIEFLGTWEKINNPNFNLVEFHQIKTEAGLNRFIMSVKKWRDKTNAVGIVARTGKYNSGTYAHKDIAYEFASWLSPEFKLYLIREFQRLKTGEAKRDNTLDWNLARFVAAKNYRIHTDAIQKSLIPILSEEQKKWVYPNEADMINFVLFGMTAKEWRDKNPELAAQNKNIRDEADLHQLIVLSNLQSSSGVMIDAKLPPEERLQKLHSQALRELSALSATPNVTKKKPPEPLLFDAKEKDDKPTTNKLLANIKQDAPEFKEKHDFESNLQKIAKFNDKKK